MKNKRYDEDCFSDCWIMGSTELKENGTYEKGYSRGFRWYPVLYDPQGLPVIILFFNVEYSGNLDIICCKTI